MTKDRNSKPENKIVYARAVMDCGFIDNQDARFGDPLADKDLEKLRVYNLLVGILRKLFAFRPWNHIRGEAACTFTADQWNEALEGLLLGFVKDTAAHGTSSVSMGTSHRKFRSDVVFRKNIFVNGNCGTGSMKGQIYVRLSNDSAYCLGENKEGKVNPNFNAVQIGSFLPPNAVPRSTFVAQLREWYAAWERDCNSVWGFSLDTVEAELFITGPARAHYYDKCDETAQREMDEEVKRLVQEAAPCFDSSMRRGSFFMKQKAEADFEAAGTAAMYENLWENGLLQTPFLVTGSAGCGRGSIQFLRFLTSQTDTPFVMEALERGLYQENLANDFFADLFRFTRQDLPVLWAMKSLFAMYFNLRPKLQEELLRRSQELKQAQEATKAPEEDIGEGDEGEEEGDDHDAGDAVVSAVNQPVENQPSPLYSATSFQDAQRNDADVAKPDFNRLVAYAAEIHSDLKTLSQNVEALLRKTNASTEVAEAMVRKAEALRDMLHASQKLCSSSLPVISDQDVSLHVSPWSF